MAVRSCPAAAGCGTEDGRARVVRGYRSANVSNVMYGLMPVSLTVVGTLWRLVELVVAGEMGACFYRDE